jgi:hypothetical protein
MKGRRARAKAAKLNDLFDALKTAFTEDSEMRSTLVDRLAHKLSWRDIDELGVVLYSHSSGD